MLALIAIVVALAPDAEMDQSYGERSTVQLELFTASGLLQGMVPAATAGAPLMLEGELGLRVWRPRWVEGGGRPVYLLGVRYQHSFYDSRDAMLGLCGLGVELWRLTVMATAGFGLGFVPGFKPQPTVPIGLRLSMHLGPVAVGVGYERLFQFRSLDSLDPDRAGLPGCISLFVTRTFDVTD